MGKPGWRQVQSPAPEYIGCVEGTWGSETSQYPLEEKTTCDSVSSGERKRRRLNLGRVRAGRCCGRGVVGRDRMGAAVSVVPFAGVSGRLLERVAVVGESPVRENTCGGS